MKIEKQVCTLEQAKKLKELGIKADTFLYLFQMSDDEAFQIKTKDYCIEFLSEQLAESKAAIEGIKNGYSYNVSAAIELAEKLFLDDIIYSDQDFIYPAFTVAELGVMLPNESGVRALTSYYNDHMGLWYCESRIFDQENDDALPDLEHEEEGDTEAESRAEMLIYLLENNLITAEKVNANLNNHDRV